MSQDKASAPLLEAERLSYGIPQGPILAQDVSFKLVSRQLLFVSGQNGSGKSTLLRVILGHLKASAGELRVNVPIEKIGMLPQLQNAIFHLPLTLMDVLEISSKEKLTEERVLSFGLLERAQLKRAWNTASGGERKRTLLTRVLLQSPSLLLLDEPQNHLDRASRERVKLAVKHYLTEPGDHPRAVVLVSHDPWEDLDFGEEGIVPLKLRGAE